MIYRIEVRRKETPFPYKVYLIKTDVKSELLEKNYIDIFGDRVTENVKLYLDAKKEKNSHEIHYLPGVIDPAEESIKKILKEYGILAQRIKTGTGYPLQQNITNLYNPLVQFILKENDSAVFIETTELKIDENIVELLNMDDESLIKLSEEMTLSLNLEEMRTIQKFYAKEKRNPARIELETLAQTWSEHCKHKTFNSEFLYKGKRYKSLLKDTIFKTTEDINHSFCLSVFKDNSGVIEFNEDYGISFKVETHNHPSALEPYGGASTGIGGVIRDCLGTGRGAKPIMNTDFFVAPAPETKEGINSIWFLKGVVAGVRDYGNRMGIPTLAGGVYFHQGYSHNPLVYAGTVGLIKKDRVEKSVKKGDIILLAGARTGKDGIHGATFSSKELDDKTKLYTGVVQIGNPVEEKKLMEAILKSSELDLFNSITDCGGGGLSSAIGENVEEHGAEVFLDRVPLKYKGLTPSEIWISESQERMIIFAPEQNVEKIKKIFEKEEVEITPIGVVTDTGRLILKYKEKIVGDIDLDFLHNGLPRRTIEAEEYIPQIQRLKNPIEDDFNDILIKLISHPIVASKEYIVRQYDHEVQSRSILKPIAENSNVINNDGSNTTFVNNNGSVLLPLREKKQAVGVSHGFNPLYGLLSPYRMALSVVDEAIRNLICIGVNPEKIALLDNFCWGDVSDKKLLGALVEASEGCYEASTGFKVPFISGKDSLNNYSIVKGKRISIPPTLLISAIGIIDNISFVRSSDFKEENNSVFLVGETKNEMGGSLLYHIYKANEGEVPALNINRAREIYNRIHQGIKNGVIKSLHDLSEGGLAVALSEMAIGGGIGAVIEIDSIELPPLQALFSESNSRILIETDKEKELLKLMTGLPIYKLGNVGGDKLIIKDKNNTVINLSIKELEENFRKTLPDLMEAK